MTIHNDIKTAAANTERNPSDAQKESGNYAKGKVRLHGMEIAIENPKGGQRSGTDKGGKKWAVTMPAHYGYVKGTEGKDGDHVDCYIGPQPDSQKVYVVNQVDAGTGRFDEHKCMLGYSNKEQALADYKRAFSDGKGADRIGSVKELNVSDFKAWLKHGNTKTAMTKTPNPALDLARRYANGGRVGYAAGGGTYDESALDALIQGGTLMPQTSARRAERAMANPHLDQIETSPWHPWDNPSEGGSQFYTPVTPHYFMEVDDERGPTGGFVQEGGRRMPSPMGRMGYAEGGAPEDTVSVPSYTLGGKRMEGARPKTIQEKTMAEEPWKQMARDAGAFGSGAVDAAGFGLPGTILDYAAPGLGAAVHQNYDLANAGADTLGGFLGSYAAPYKTAAKVVGAGAKYLGVPAGLVLGGAMLDSAKAGDEKRPPLVVKQIQERLSKSGDYTGKIDGIDGEATRDAEAIFAKRQSAEDRRLQMEQDATQAQIEAAKATRTQAEQEGKARESAEARQKENAEKLTQVEADTPWWRTAARTAAPYVGYGIGMLAGPKAAKVLTGRFAGAEAEAVARANDLMKGRMAGKSLHERIGKANQFATEGGAAGDAPFVQTGTAPYWKVNPKAAATSELYTPESRAAEYAVNPVSALGVFGGEAALTTWMAQRAQQEVDDARKAMEQDPNDANVAHYQSAQDKMAGWELASGAGRVAAPLQIMKGAQLTYTRPFPRPNLSKADAERGAIAEMLADKKLAAKAAKERAAAKGTKAGSQKSTAKERKPNGAGPASLLPLTSLPLLGEGQESPESNLSASDASVLSNQDDGHAAGGTVAPHHSYFQPRDKLQRFRGGPVYNQKKAPDMGRKYGGEAVNPSLALARRYASGGGVGYDGGGPVEDTAPMLPRQVGTPEPKAPTMWDQVLPYLPLAASLALTGLVPRGRAMAKTLEAKAVQAFDKPTANKLDFGITGGEPNRVAGNNQYPWATSHNNPRTYIDSSSDLGAQTGMMDAGQGLPFKYPEYILRPKEKLPIGNDNSFGVIQGGKFATGGAVTGAILGSDGGRDDTKPVSVPSGAYVIPADCVSGLPGAGGNSLAGAKLLAQQFGKSQAHMASGGHVGIKISDGEFVLGPDQVAKIGGGSVEHGHRILDAMVRKIRADHVKTLKSLPGPARD